MNESSFIALIHNASLLFALALIFDSVAHHFPVNKINAWQIPLGIVIGVIGISVMESPWLLMPGVIFDTRSVLLGISGLFFGLLPTIIAIIITAAWRIHLGGEAAIMGVAVILSTGVIGILWRHLSKRKLHEFSFTNLFLFGFVIHIDMLLMAFLLPWHTALTILEDITLPVLIIYPAATALLGLLMTNRLKRERISEKLADSEERLRLAVESGNIGLFFSDLKSNHFEISGEWKNQIGYEDHEIDENNIEWENRLHPDDKDRVLAKLNACIADPNSNYECEYRILHKDGTYRWILAKALIHRDTQGNAVRLVGTHIDITQIKNTENDLRDSREQYRLLTENIKDVVWIMDAETKQFKYVSPSIERQRGYTAEEVLSQPALGAVINDVQNETGELIQKRLDDFSKGIIKEDHFFTDEVPQSCKDGSIVWTEVITNFYLNPESGRVEVRGVSRDISDRRQTEEIMENAQHDLHRMLREADQSRRSLLSVAEDQKIAEDALRKTANDLMVAYDATLKGWSTALEMRERETAGHSMRVVEHTLELAKLMNIDGEEMIHIKRGALLHDIGKMAVPDSILLKPGPLTDDEWVVMRQHPTYAYRLLSNIPYLLPALDIPYFHHERWDGSGYPHGLVGENIPIEARIFAVVDVWDALSSDRPYRPAWTADAVVKYLKDHTGKQFDPEVVQEFLKIII